MSTLIHDVTLDPESFDNKAIMVEAEEEPIHVVEADEEPQVLIVEEDEKNEKSQEVSASSELWRSPEDFLHHIRRVAQLDAHADKRSPNTLRAIIAHLQEVRREIVRTAMSPEAYADFSTEQLQQLDELEGRIESSSTALQHILDQLEDERSEAILSHLESQGFIKKAWKSADITLTTDPFLFGITRLCINAKVTNGKDIEEVYATLADQYKLDDREKLAVAMLLRDSGYPIRGSLIGDIDQITQFFG